MFKQFISESFRSKMNRPQSFIINWLGLTLGFTAVIVMYLHIVGQFRHDTCFSRPMTDVYRVEVNKMMQGITPQPLAEFLTQSIPEIKATTQLIIDKKTVGDDGPSGSRNNFKLSVMSVDSSFQQVLPFAMVSGGDRDALSDKNKAMVSRSTADKLYNTTDVIGKNIMIDNKTVLQITGVFEDQPTNSHLSADVMILMDYEQTGKTWGNWIGSTFLLTTPGADTAVVRPKVEKGVQAKISANWGNEYKDPTNLRAFNDLYFETEVYGQGKTVNKESLTVLGLIAILILVIAIVNYVNIYTARSTEVIRSMGIKSIMGASRKGLIGFIIGDSLVITFLAVLAAFGLAFLLRPLYPSIIGTSVSFSISWDMILVLFVGFPLLCGMLSGVFPAITMTNLKPLDAMANRSSGGRQMTYVRNGLMIFQFVISIGLIAFTLLINKQMKYVNSVDMGYNRENIVYVGGGAYMPEKFEMFRSALMRNPNVKEATVMDSNPMYIGNISTFMLNQTPYASCNPHILYGDAHTFAVLDLAVLDGDSVGDANVRTLGVHEVMVNESFAKLLKEHQPEFVFPGKDYIGMFRNFRHQGLNEVEVPPMIFGSIYSMGENALGDAYIRVAGTNMDATMKHIAECFREIWPDEVYDFGFMDVLYNNMYKREQLFRSQLMTFSILAVMIGCLGLYALVGYSVVRRRKEIAVRKVYGASIGEVVVMLCVSFLKWLLVSFLIAIPIVWYLMRMWLEDYAFRTDIGWIVFALAAVITLMIALLTVIEQSYKAATENPASAVKE